MRRAPSLPEIGRVVEVIRGRDAGTFAVVIGHEPDRFVLLADGDRRKVDRPKKKNVLHIRRTPVVATEIQEQLRAEGKITNARLRHVMKQFYAANPRAGEEREEGSVPHGERGCH
ncbi:hypothetical protein GCM10010885_07640 [Alicyclobacillus cellulosilyticus]|uniref:Ribosomal protein L14E/L6E/L27E n=1 Tax=Alicyclobacillus cellulosilyticus TaxID=1003997 RepID=A0A917K4P5_9BACL|nr:KOW domain-containing RNA-binding protein [Alicyclobacillus cellulosilyticus]GGJ00914.1 hypothetical protein GCM10010885_07640 [Alicyclobacillus cellulosilyticus]